MGAGQERMGNERGMVLFSSLLILSLLITVGVGARLMLQSDYRILANLRGSTEAFYLADAGIEWAKYEIGRTVTHPPSPGNHTQSFASGTFAVTFLSPTAVTPLVAKIPIRSTGAARTSTQTVRAQATKTYDLADSAMALRGSANRVAFSGNGYFVSGLDHDPASGELVPSSKPRLAISVSDDALRGMVEAELAGMQESSVVGGGAGESAIARSDFMPASAIAALADELCGAPHAISTIMPSGGVLSLENEIWGSRASPQARCINGLPASGDVVELGNVIGAGVLIVRDAEVIAQGSFRWEGLVIVSGNNVGFKVMGTDSKEVLGALIVNETGTPGTEVSILDIQGALRLLFSRPALSIAADLIPSATMARTYTALPFTVTQDYWRTLSP